MDCPQQRATLNSLLEWVNTFGDLDTKCETFKDLCSGYKLLTCLHSVFPDVDVSSSEPWKEIWITLEELCGCTLEKAISLEEVVSGDQEHVARVVVLLLCFAVQKKPNDDIIAGILSLSTEVQLDLKFFIESTIAQVKSHAISTGTFQSGIGESLPSLDSLESLPPVYPELPLCLSDSEDKPDQSLPLISQPQRANHRASNYFPTPRRPSKLINRGNFYDGLNSPACLKWLQSPLISKHRTVECTPLSFRKKCSVSNNVNKMDSEISEEFLTLQHRLQVLNKRFKSEQAITEELSDELQSKTAAYEELDTINHQLQMKLTKFSNMGDICDELEQKNLELAKAEKTLERFKTDVESLLVYRETAKQLEKKMENFKLMENHLREYKEKTSTLEADLTEKSTALKKLELTHQNTLIKLQAKINQQDFLLQQNITVSKENREMLTKCKCLDENNQSLEAKIKEQFEDQQATVSVNTILLLETEILQTTNRAAQENVNSLNLAKEELETKLFGALSEHKKFKKLVKGQKQTLQNTNEKLKMRLKTVEADLETVETVLTETSATLKELELTHQNTLIELKANIFQQDILLQQNITVSKEKMDLLEKCEWLYENNQHLETRVQEQLVEQQADIAENGALLKLEILEAANRAAQDDAIFLNLAKEELETKLLEALSEHKEFKKLVEVQRQTLQDANEEVKMRLKTVEGNLETVEADLTETSATLKEVELTHRNTLTDLAKTHQQDILQQQKITVSNENEELLEKCRLLEEIKQSFETNIHIQFDELQAAVAEKRTLLLKLEILQATNRASQGNVNSLNLAKEELETKLLGALSEHKEFKEQIEGQKQTLQNTNEELKMRLKTVEADLETVETDLTETSATLKELELTHQNTLIELQVSNENKELLEKCKCLDESKQSMETKMQEQFEEHQNVLAELETLQATNRAAQNDLDSLNLAKEELETKLLGALSEHKEFKEQIEGQRQTLQNTNEELKMRLKTVEADLELQVDNLPRKLQQEQEVHTAEIQRIHHNSTQISAQMEETILKLSEENTSLHKHQSNLHKMLDELTYEKQDALTLSEKYNTTLEEERTTCVALKEQRKELESVIAGSTTTSQTLEKDIQNVSEELHQCLKELARQQNHNSMLVSENRSVEAQLAFASQKLKDLEKSKILVDSSRNPHSLRSLHNTANTKSRWAVSDSSSEEESFSTLHYVFDRKETESTIPLKTSFSGDEESFVPDRQWLSKQATLANVPCLISKPGPIKISEIIGDKKKRVGELQRRNKMTLPHLKSSYPVEMQVQPESPSVSNEQVKNGLLGQSRKPSSLFSHSTSSADSAKPIAFEISLQDSGENESIAPKSKKHSRERGDVLIGVFPESPPTIRRRCLGASPAPQSTTDQPPARILGRHTAKELRRTTSSGLALRGYLNDKSGQGSNVDSSNNGTAFEIAFSPPKAKPPLPKHLKRLKTGPSTKASAPVPKENKEDRRQTIVKSKRQVIKHNVTSSRIALKTKN